LDFASELSISSYLTASDRSFAIEDLRVSGSLKNHKLSGAIADLDFYGLKRQLE
jgi:putative transposase